MASGFGIAALVAAILAIFIPIYGGIVSAVAIAGALIAAATGERIFATATSAIVALNTFLLSPVLFFPGAPFSEINPNGKTNLILASAAIAAPACIALLKQIFPAVGTSDGITARNQKDEPLAQAVHTAPATRPPAPPIQTYAAEPSAHINADANMDIQETHSRNGAESAMAALSRWETLIKYDPEAAAADQRIRPLGEKALSSLATSFFESNDKSKLHALVEQIVAAGLNEVRASSSTPAEKWKLLALYDAELKDAEQKVVLLGEKWLTRLIEDYIVLNDKQYLKPIVDRIFAEERHALGISVNVIDQGSYRGIEWRQMESGIVEGALKEGRAPFTDMDDFTSHVNFISVRQKLPAHLRFAADRSITGANAISEHGATTRASWRKFENGIFQATTPDGQFFYFRSKSELERFLQI